MPIKNASGVMEEWKNVRGCALDNRTSVTVSFFTYETLLLHPDSAVQPIDVTILE